LPEDLRNSFYFFGLILASVHSLKLIFGFGCALKFCWGFFFKQRLLWLMLICAFLKEMYILVPSSETMLNIYRFFLVAAHGYGTEAGRDFEAKVC
jgi:hypothetical protein